jgi:glycosyltransferase involved in cell wall biosynthesis
MPDRLRGWDVVVLPSLTRPNWKEQFGRILVEAMACAVPVVASGSGEIPNVVGDAGVLVPEGDAGALRAALAALLADPARRQELGRRGRARALERYTHRRIAEATARVYRTLLP